MRTTWYDEAVFYHIYPLGLSGAPKKNNGGEVTNRFQDLEKWILHMKRMGFTALYIGPLFESVGHGYETTDYKLVDRRLGDNNSFKHFTEKCHENGIKVVVDGVFNHTGREFSAFQDLKKNRENSAYKDWYCNVNFGGNNEYNDGFSYEAWRGYNELAKLNQRNPEVKKYIFEVIHFWIQEFDIDGIRLDCADVLDFDFMKEMRNFTEEEKKDFWLMGEVIHGDYSRWVNPNTLHSVTNYELHKALYSGHNDHNYFEIAHNVKRLFDGNGGLCKDASLYSFADNHDVDRLVSKLKTKENLYPIYTLIYTLPGIPSIYYGSEFGLEGKKENGSDEPVRPCLHLEDYMDGEDFKEEYKKPAAFLQNLAKIRKKNKALSYGVYKELMLTNKQYAFARILEDNIIITVVNNDDDEAEAVIPVSEWSDKSAMNLMDGSSLVPENGKITVTMEPNSGVVFRMEKEKRDSDEE